MIHVRESVRANHLRRLLIVLPLVLLTQTIRANEDPTELLNSEVQYHHDKNESTKTRPGTSQLETLNMTPAKTQACCGRNNDPLQELNQRNEQRRSRQELEIQLTERHQTITTAGPSGQNRTIDPAKQAMAADSSAVWQQVKNIRNLLSGAQPPDLINVRLFSASSLLRCNQSHPVQRLGDLTRENVPLKNSIVKEDFTPDALQQEKQAAVANLTALREQPDLSRQKEKTSLKQAVAELNSRIGVLVRENETLKVSIVQQDYALGALQKQSKEVGSRMLKQGLEVTSIRNEILELSERTPLLANPDNLKGSEKRQAYAAGGALGRDIINMLEERKSWGINTDRQFVLAGVIDAFSGHYQLQQDELTTALADSEILATKAREKFSSLKNKNTEPFVAKFKQQKGVKYSETGFWYRIDYAGDTHISDDTIIDVVVKESLTDGTVVHDMSLDNKVLSQPLNSFPAIFRESIGHLRNHGSLTMVVPPELAYGKNGYPPKIPPDATMIYELRIDNVKKIKQ